MAEPSLLVPAIADGRLSKSDQIYASLRQAIMRCDLRPGEAIDKTALCRSFEVSRLPVTTAINRLAFEDLVVIERQRGSYVSRIRLKDILQWLLVRRAIEAEVAGMAAGNARPEAIENLNRNLRYQAAAVASDDHESFRQLDVAFHRILTDGLDLERVAQALDGLRLHIDRVRWLLLPEEGRMTSTLKEHRAIFVAVRKRDRQIAERAMRRHIDVVTERLVAFERDHAEFFGQ
jgi:DNA-binding GntR family transcriptional regulator